MSGRQSSLLARTVVLCAGGALAMAAAPSAHADILVAWGSDNYGQLGDGEPNATPRLTPAPVLNLGRIVSGGRGILGDAIASDMTVAVQGGALYRWGTLYLGETPEGSAVYGADPVPHVRPHFESGVTLVSGFAHAVKDGVLYSFDEVTPAYPAPHPVAGAPLGITLMASGGVYPTYLVVRDGGLWSWGQNQYGMLGIGSAAPSQVAAAPVAGFESGVTAISVGDWHCALVKDGVAYTWGANYRGALGLGLPQNTSGNQYTTVRTPQPVQALGGGVTAISAGSHFTVAVRDGFVYSWGDHVAAQFGYPGVDANAPVQVPGLHDITDVSTNEFLNAALCADGTVWTWGRFTPMRHVLPPELYRFTSVKAGSVTLATMVPACAADFGTGGGVFAPDGRLDNNDLVVFIDAFFAQDPMADMGSAGAVPRPDGAFDNNDFIVFVERFFGGC